MPDRLTPLLSADEIARRVRELATAIQADYSDKDVLLVGILNGAAVFLADLMRQLDMPLTVDFLRASSYGDSTESTGVVQIRKDLDTSPTQRHVILVEDIVDTGLTLDFLTRHIEASQPASVEVCTLLDKPSRRKIDVTPKYVGFPIHDHFVVGYGLDYAERYRNLPGVFELEIDPSSER